MKTTSEVLDTISSTLAPNFAELAYCITLEGQDFNVLIDVVQKAMVEYASHVRDEDRKIVAKSARIIQITDDHDLMNGGYLTVNADSIINAPKSELK